MDKASYLTLIAGHKELTERLEHIAQELGWDWNAGGGFSFEGEGEDSTCELRWKQYWNDGSSDDCEGTIPTKLLWGTEDDIIVEEERHQRLREIEEKMRQEHNDRMYKARQRAEYEMLKKQFEGDSNG